MYLTSPGLTESFLGRKNTTSKDHSVLSVPALPKSARLSSTQTQLFPLFFSLMKWHTYVTTQSRPEQPVRLQSGR